LAIDVGVRVAGGDRLVPAKIATGKLRAAKGNRIPVPIGEQRAYGRDGFQATVEARTNRSARMRPERIGRLTR
jgi:hypothetical protein